MSPEKHTRSIEHVYPSRQMVFDANSLALGAREQVMGRLRNDGNLRPADLQEKVEEITPHHMAALEAGLETPLRYAAHQGLNHLAHTYMRDGTSRKLHLQALEILQRKIPHIADHIWNENFVEQLDGGRINLTVESFVALLHNKEGDDAIQGVLKRQWPMVRDKLRIYQRRSVVRNSLLQFAGLLTTSYDRDSRTKAITWLRSRRPGNQHKQSLSIEEISPIVNTVGQFVGHRHQIADLFVGKSGIDARLLVQSWEKNERPIDMPPYLAGNIESILTVDEGSKGAARALHSEFGIENFGRYHDQFLETQYRKRDDRDHPWGLFIQPKYDHNGGFNNKKDTLATDILMGLRQINKTHADQQHIRIIEVDSNTVLQQRLDQLRNRYGTKCVSFAMLSGHGGRDHVQLGSPSHWPDSRLTIGHLSTGCVDGLHALMCDGAPLVLESCSTGQEGGIGQALSYRWNRRVLAPSVDTNIQSVILAPDIGQQNSVFFSVEYKDNCKVWYQNGKKVAQ